MKGEIIKLIYLYTFSAIGLILVVISSVKIVDIFLREYIFKDADMIYTYFPENISENEQTRKIQIETIKSERQKVISSSISMLIIGLPLFIYHWKILRKDNFY
ncbi:MAG: hypothetical protein N3D75_01380 [Candidatus Aenigmarchaeota archaeon]|nr:hypothetical protein [Candidatus Aenigmarchaeota archaeon]